MSCPLLEKLAPETRDLIYEYVLTFDAPLKHVYDMQPFVEKHYLPGDSETETASGAESSYTEDSLQRVNTSILTTSKLIYTEAIAAFYKSNVVTVHSRICTPGHVTTILAADLALATKVVVKLMFDLEAEKHVGVGLSGSTNLLLEGFPQMFPKLNAGSVCIYTDFGPAPVVVLFAAAHAMRLSGTFHTVQFEGVGLVAAYPKDQSKLRLVVQSQTAIDNWKTHGTFDSLMTSNMSARDLDLIAKMLFEGGKDDFLPPGYPVFEAGSHEFWTITSELMRQTRPYFELAQLQGQARV